MVTSGFIGAPEPFDERTEDWTLYARGVRHQVESRTLCLESQMESRILPWNLESCPSNKSK